MIELKRHTGLLPLISTMSYEEMVARGQVPGVSGLSQFGYNNIVGTSFEDIWDVGGVYDGWLTSAAALSVVSASADDDAAGTGARTIRISGLDADYAEISTDVILDGTTPVVVATKFLRISKAYVLTVGSGGVGAGLITITSGAKTMARIAGPWGQTQMAMWTVPAGKVAVVKRIWASTSVAQGVLLHFIVREFGGAWRERILIPIYAGLADLHLLVPIILSAKTDMLIGGVATADAKVTAAFELTYEDAA